MNPLAIFEVVTTAISFISGLFSQNKQKQIQKKQEELTKTELEANLSTLDYNIQIMEQNVGALQQEKETVLGGSIEEGMFGREYKQKKGGLVNALAASGIKLNKGTAKTQQEGFEEWAQQQRSFIETQYNVAIEKAQLQLEQTKSEYDIYKEYYDKTYNKKPFGVVSIMEQQQSNNKKNRPNRLDKKKKNNTPSESFYTAHEPTI